MIRREVGDELWLITQHDHAQLAGQLAEHFGNEHFQAPQPREKAIQAVAMHDCGWPLHDDCPLLNPRGLPSDVFETPREVGLKVWTASAERAAGQDPYVGLLVSLHSLSLSILATTMTPLLQERFNWDDPRSRFEINKFQHAQIELQEALRRKLGMRIALPLTHGLAENSDDPRERQLLFNFRLLQAMDKLSLCLCCTTPPFQQVEPLLPQPGAAPQCLRAQRPAPQQLLIWPWPFDQHELDVTIPYRSVPNRPYTDPADLHALYHPAPLQHLRCTLTTSPPP